LIGKKSVEKFGVIERPKNPSENPEEFARRPLIWIVESVRRRFRVFNDLHHILLGTDCRVERGKQRGK
jgi:hypothetical protein